MEVNDIYEIKFNYLVLKRGDEVKSISSWPLILDTLKNLEEASFCYEDLFDIIRSIAKLSQEVLME